MIWCGKKIKRGVSEAIQFLSGHENKSTASRACQLWEKGRERERGGASEVVNHDSEMCQQTSNNNGHTAVTASSAVTLKDGRTSLCPVQDKRASISNWVMISRWFVTKYAMKATKNAEQKQQQSRNKERERETKADREREKKIYQKRIKLSET